MRFTSCVLSAALLILGAGASPAWAAPEPDVEVVVQRGADGTWTADYRFARAAPAWAFPRSAVTEAERTPWRPQAWTVETPGVTLERHGRYDVLTAGGAPLRSVRVRFTPFTADVFADYRPTLQFSDGGQAHYTNQFELVPLASAAEADGLGPDVDSGVYGTTSRLTFKDPGRRILFAGETRTGEVVTASEVGGYAYFGDAPLVETDALTALLDPGLPAWIRAELGAVTPRLLALHAERLGRPAGARPTVFAAWAGADRPGASYQGGVLPGLVQMNLSGQQALTPDPRIRNLLLWFFGHETTHFWLGQTVSVPVQADNWMLEGGADLLAIRALGRVAPEYDARPKLQAASDDCLKLIGPGEPLATALDRGEHRAQYACGALLTLAAEAGMRRRDPQADAYDFWRGLIELNRADGKVELEDWLAAFEQATGDAALTGRVRQFVMEGVDDPSAFVADLLKRSGVGYSLQPDGTVKLA